MYKFDREQKKVEAMKSVAKQDVLILLDEYILQGGRNRRRAVSQIYGLKHPFSDSKNSDDSVIVVSNAREIP